MRTNNPYTDENTVYDDEERNIRNEANDCENESTIYDEEPTVINDEPTRLIEEVERDEPTVMETKKGGMWKRVVINGSVAMVFGAAGAVLTSFVNKPEATTDDSDTSDNSDNTNNTTDNGMAALTDGEVSMATCVDDNMTFGQAFAAARAEVGPGGVFEWHDQLYGTYYASEWDAMTPQQQAEFNDHFAWSHGHGASTSTASTTTTTTDHPHDVAVHVEATPANNNNSEPVVEVEPEVEVLGVVHDESGANVAVLEQGGQDYILVDVDGDGVFDAGAADVNGNGQIDNNEIIPLEAQVTVSDLGGFTDGTNDMASNDGPDYIDNGVYDA